MITQTNLCAPVQRFVSSAADSLSPNRPCRPNMLPCGEFKSNLPNRFVVGRVFSLHGVIDLCGVSLISSRFGQNHRSAQPDRRSVWVRRRPPACAPIHTSSKLHADYRPAFGYGKRLRSAEKLTGLAIGSCRVCPVAHAQTEQPDSAQTNNLRSRCTILFENRRGG